jgi:hypothetical protein
MEDPTRKSQLAQWRVTSSDLVAAAKELGVAMFDQNDATKGYLAGVAGISLEQRDSAATHDADQRYRGGRCG